MAPDSMTCPSCGESINDDVEVCPRCGVDVDAVDPTAKPSSPTDSTAEAPEFETTVSDRWYYGVVAGVVGWTVVVLLTGFDVSPALLTVLGMTAFGLWILLPVATYYDSKYVASETKWDPSTSLWVLTMAIWFVNILAGLYYLYRRHRAFEAT